jgi:hypothetical protein
LKQEKEGFVFQSETDTEVVAKLALYFYKFLKERLGHRPEFRRVVTKVVETIVFVSSLPNDNFTDKSTSSLKLFPLSGFTGVTGRSLCTDIQKQRIPQ